MTLTPAGPPRGLIYGLIHYEAGHPPFQHARYLPGTDLAPFVEHYWIVAWDLRGQPPHVQSTLPHPSVHLVLEAGQSRVVGIYRGRFTRTLDGRGGVFGVKFRPGGFHPFLRHARTFRRHPIKGCPTNTREGCPTSVSQLTGRTLDAKEIFGDAVQSLEQAVFPTDDADAEHRFSGADHASDVGHRFSGADHETMVAAAERFLRKHRPLPDPLATRAGDIVAGILADRTMTRVSQVATNAGLTERQLQRLFSRYVGVSPKWVIQRYRLHEALDRVDQGEIVDWASLAADLGYFDQPHFIRDFRRMVGQTPANYRTERTVPGQT